MADDAALPTPGPAKRPARLALWGALAVLAVGIGAVAVVAGRDGGSDALGARRLPISLGSAGGSATTAEGRAAGASADMSMAAYVHYTAGADLPVLGGDAPAYRIRGEVDLDALRKVAARLGLSGEPHRNPDSKGEWTIRDGDRVLGAAPYGGGQWWFVLDAPVATGGGSTGCEGGPDASCSSPPAEPTKPLEPGDQPIATTTDVDRYEEPPPPADLPSEAEAKRIAVDLLGATGIDLSGADVTVEGPSGIGLIVNVVPTVDGRPAGLSMSAILGSHGAVLSANGILGVPEALGTYPTVDTRTAIERLNDGSAYGGGYGYGVGGREVAVDAAAPETSTTLAAPTVCTRAADLASDGGAEPAIAPDIACPGPPDAPEPIEVVLHRAERILVAIDASDGSGDSYLVPGYRMTGDDGQIVDVPAIDEASILPTPTTVPADEPATLPGSIEPAPAGGAAPADQ